MIFTTTMKIGSLSPLLLCTFLLFSGEKDISTVQAFQQPLSSLKVPTKPSARTTSITSSPYSNIHQPSLFATIPRAEEDAKTDLEDITAASSSSSNLGTPIPYSQLTIGVLKETYKGENRVSQTPESIQSMIKAGMTVVVQSGGTYVMYK